MRFRISFWAVLLLGLTLACNLTSATDDETTPTPQVVVSPIVTVASTPIPLATNAPTGATQLPPSTEFFVTITSPTAGATVNVNGFTVQGQQRGSFENNVVVQVRDLNGNVLGQSPTTSTGEPGTIGDWQITMTAPASMVGQQGRIYVFYTSARDGSEMANAWVDVRFVNN